MNTKVNEREQDREKQSRNMSDLKPGRSAMPPAFGLTASKPGPAGGSLLSASIGRKGENRPEDLIRFGKYLQSIGAPPVLIAEAVDPSRNGDLIAKYQKQVMKFRNPDGRIDPGGKTETAIREQRGRETVAGWYRTKPKETEAPKAAGKDKKKGEGLAKPTGKGKWLIPPVLGKGDYITQAPPSKAQHSQTLPKDKLFRFSLAKYGPGGSKDIADEAKVKKSWRKLSYQQRFEKVHWIACMNTCVAMMEKVGASPDFSKSVTTISEDLKAKTIEANGNLDAGVSIIERNLTNGQPVVMGVHKNFKGQNSDATDHFVLGVGLWQEGSRIGIAYFDPGTGRASGWDVANNIIWIDAGEQMATDEKNYGSEKYTLSRVTDNE